MFIYSLCAIHFILFDISGFAQTQAMGPMVSLLLYYYVMLVMLYFINENR